jgi:hypothetical protein
MRGLAHVDIVDAIPDEYVAASKKVLGANERALTLSRESARTAPR